MGLRVRVALVGAFAVLVVGCGADIELAFVDSEQRPVFAASATVVPTATSVATATPELTATAVPASTSTPMLTATSTPVVIEFAIGPNAPILGIELGAGADDAMGELIALIGEPDADTDWYVGCPLDDDLNECLLQ